MRRAVRDRFPDEIYNGIGIVLHPTKIFDEDTQTLATRAFIQPSQSVNHVLATPFFGRGKGHTQRIPMIAAASTDSR